MVHDFCDVRSKFFIVSNALNSPAYPKRLIEVDLPIKRISAHARREKSIRHGHISTLHIWWARRPLAACRAVICASLWPDPADPNCPAAFIEAAYREMRGWTKHERLVLLSEESRIRFEKARRNTAYFENNTELRAALLDFIADFANWDNSTNPDYLETSRALTQAAHEALGGEPGTRSLVVDPFAGGGSIPLESLRVGADAFASDLNPLPVLLNKVVLEYIPKYGQRLADEVRKWGESIKKEAEEELAEFYPKDPDGATPIAYLWARTIQCEGPSCGVKVPLIRSLWLAKKSNRSVALRLVPNPRAKRVDLSIIGRQRGEWVNETNASEKIVGPKFDGTVKRGSVTCPCCGYTTPVSRVREQLKAREGGANDARLLCVVTTREGEPGRSFRLPNERDHEALEKSAQKLTELRSSHKGSLTLIPQEVLPVMSGVFNAPIYGHNTWGSLFTSRQLLGLVTMTRLVRDVVDKIPQQEGERFANAVQLVLALGVTRVADISNALCTWKASMVQAIHLPVSKKTLVSRRCGFGR